MLVAAAGLALVACGSTDDGTTASELPAATAAPASEPDAAPAQTAAPADTAAPAQTAAPAADPPPATESPADTPADSAAEPAAAPEAQLGGRDLGGELNTASDFDGNIFPDLLVDDIRAQAKVNVRNIFPADRPVLVWMWAPH